MLHNNKGRHRQFTFVRIEHKEDGLGMFVSTLIRPPRRTLHQLELYDAEGRHNNLNTRGKDNLPATHEFFCGYKSVDQLKEWLTPHELHVLFENGFRVFQITARNVWEGRDQVVFKTKNITSKTDITNLFYDTN
jgi:hypothetical protein